MTASRMTFGEHLKQFALSIDFIDSGQYELVQRQLLKYLHIQLDAVQVAFLEPIRVDEEEGIATVWSAPHFRIQQTLRCNGEYRRQLALALGDTRDLWVISETKEPLSEGNTGVDVWGEAVDADLPPFQAAPGAPPTRTSISLITRGAQMEPNGVFLVDIGNRVRPTRILRREMQLLADAVGLLHASDWATHEQKRGTANAIARLTDLVPSSELETGPRPFLFVASSSQAEEDVSRAIQDVLDEFSDRIYARHWSEMHRPGNISVQLAQEIGSAQYGICYLSEPFPEERREEGGPQYRDNPNVLVEAGMLHMVTRSSGGTDTGWIPIRERTSAPAPFDLEHQRMVLVEREDGKLDEQGFKASLRDKLHSLLQGDPVWSTGPVADPGADAPAGPVEAGPRRPNDALG